MAGRTAHRRRVLLAAVAVGVWIGLAFVLIDVLVDVTFLGVESFRLFSRVEVWVRLASVVFAVVASVAYARLLLAKEDVAAASQRYRTLAESARDDIFVIERDRRVSYMNSHAASEFGGTPERLEGRSVRELFGAPEVEHVEQDLRSAFTGREVYTETEFAFPGSPKWLSTRLVPLPGPQGRVDSVLGISRDVTATKREMVLARALSSVNEAVHARLSADEILEAVSSEATGAAGADSSLVMTRDDGVWRIRHAQGYPEEVVGSAFSAARAPVLERAIEVSAPLVIDDVTADDRVNRETMEWLGVRSALAMPLATRRGVVGVLLFTGRARPVRFTPDVIGFAGRLATTVSLAIDNAMLYEEKRSVADALQAAILMLPESLPGIEFARAYHSATEAARVGGDFYDLFELTQGRIGITVGDIAGHGIDAAVLTSLVKDCVRVEAVQEQRPADEVLSRTSDMLLGSSRPEVFASVFFGVLCLSDGMLQYCSAGHTTGFVRAPDGVRALPSNSPLVGAFPSGSFTADTACIGPDDVLFLYTDGLTEARRDGQLFGEQRLRDLLARLPAADASETVREVIDEVMEFAGGRLADDLAVLALRRLHEGTEAPPHCELEV